MQIKDARIAIVQDSESYNEVIRLMMEEAAKLRIETTLPAGLKMLEELASKSSEVYHLLALDENLSGDDDGGDGWILYKKYLELGLENVVPVISISSFSQVNGIKAIGGFAAKLVEYIEKM